MKTDTWKNFVYEQVLSFCNERGLRTFTLKDFQEARESEILSFREENKHPFDKVRQQLQALRQEGILTFVDNRGTYTLREPAVLKDELLDDRIEEIKFETPEKREYVHEAFARDRGWVKEAKEKLGLYCLHPKCENTFKKGDGLPYIEVHHIIPLFQGGEDAVWNLAVVCAHHHKMAHFSDDETQKELKKLFLKIVDEALK